MKTKIFFYVIMFISFLFLLLSLLDLFLIFKMLYGINFKVFVHMANSALLNSILNLFIFVVSCYEFLNNENH